MNAQNIPTLPVGTERLKEIKNKNKKKLQPSGHSVQVKGRNSLQRVFVFWGLHYQEGQQPSL